MAATLLLRAKERYFIYNLLSNGYRVGDRSSKEAKRLTISHLSMGKYAASQEERRATASLFQSLPNLRSIPSGAYRHEPWALICSAVEIPVGSKFFPRRVRSVSVAQIENCSGIVVRNRRSTPARL
jgi:hypothetical protein